MSTSSRKLRSFHLALRKELAAQFRVHPDHPGIERIIETEAHLGRCRSSSKRASTGGSPTALSLRHDPCVSCLVLSKCRASSILVAFSVAPTADLIQWFSDVPSSVSSRPTYLVTFI
jgi:hypothetical protein